MASTYVNNLRLNEMATGDGAGTWGTTTNTNLELIGEALGYGTEAITTNADTHTSTVADGGTDAARAMYLKYTGTLDSACTITIGPNTMKRVQFIENATTGSQNIIISQGSGANITIPPGDVKVVYLDGAGSGAAVVDAFANLKVTDAAQTNITSVGTLTGLAVNGNTTLTTTDNSNTLTLISTDADAAVGPLLDLYRNSGSPADDDFIGKINFRGRNDNSQDVNYGSLAYFIQDASDGTEDAFMQMSLIKGGSSHLLMEATSTETVFNQGSVDQDFRVESDGQTHAIFVDAGNDRVGIACSSPSTALEVNNTSAGATVATFEGTYSSSGDVKLASFERNGGAVAAAVTYADAATAMEFGTTTSHPLLFTTGDTERMRITAAGGLEFQNQDFSNIGTIYATQYLANGDADTGIVMQGSNVMSMHTGNSERARFDASGNLLVGLTSTSGIATGSTADNGIYLDGPNGAIVAQSSANKNLYVSKATGYSDSDFVSFQVAGSEVGTITINSSTIQMGTGNTQLAFSDADDAFFVKNAAGANRDGTHDLGKSSARFKDLYLSGGAYIGGTGSANKLDDYEEGTWTPACGATLSTAVGHYTKIGNQVTVHYHIVSTGSLPTSTSQVIITGLPFTSNSSVLTAAPIYARYYTPNDSTLTSLIQDSETQIRLININDTNFDYTIWGELEASANNSIYIIGTATYQV